MSDTANRSGSTPAPTGVREDEELVQRRTLRDYYIILRERLWIALPIALVVAVLYGYFKSRETPMYASATTIEFQRPETTVTNQGVIDPSIHTKADIFTYVQLLKSQHIFNKVVDSFTPDQQKVILRPALRNLAPGNPPPALGSMMGTMDAEEEGETYIIRISVTHQDPDAAALIANHYVDQFIDEELMKLSGTDDEAISQLKASVNTLQNQYSAAQERVDDYIREHKNLSVDSSVDVITDELKTVNAKLEASRLELLQHENFLHDVHDYQSANRDLLDVSYIASDPTVAPLAEALRKLKADHALLAQTYLERHPKMIEVQQKIDITEKQLAKAEADSVNVLETTVTSEQRNEHTLEDEYAARNRDELNLRELRNDYDRLKLDADQAKSNLTQLLDRLNQVRTTKMMENLPIHRLDPAMPNYTPYSPNMHAIVRNTILLGLFSFVVVAVGLSFIDDRIKSAWDIESFIGVTLLGIVPDLAALRTEEKYTMMLDAKNSAGVEPFLGIYSALKIHSKLDYPKSLLITSTIPGEGKTLVSSNLAGTFARHGKRTILIDCDLRRPMIHRHFKQPNSAGIINWFDNGASLEGSVLDNPQLGITKIADNFWLLTSGGRSKTPTSLLEHPAFGQLLEKLKKEFDLVVVDSPPMGAVTDALLIAERTDELVYVCRFNRAYRKHIRLYMRTLANAKHTVLGIVLNGLSPRRIEYYSNYRYYRSYKKYYGTQT
jgi:capsular exopolysaccharide synthesis family protein